MSASDSHRAEVREAVSIAIDYAVQGTREYTAKALEDYYENRTKWVQSQTDAIMALLDSERERWIGEVKAALPQWADEAYYTKHPVLWKPVAPESNAEHYAAGFNEALDAVSKVLDDTSHAG